MSKFPGRADCSPSILTFVNRKRTAGPLFWRMLQHLEARGKAVSYWARNHRPQAWLFLTVAHALLAGLGWSAGRLLLQELPMAVRAGAWWSLVVIALLAALMYHRQPNGCRASYRSRKRLDAVLALSGFLLVALVGSGLDRRAVSWPAPEVRAASALRGRPPYHRMPDEAAEKPAKPLSLAAKIILTILIIAASLVLQMAVAAVACSIACSGAEVLAVLVAFGGQFLVIYGTVVLLSRVLRGKHYADRLRRRLERHTARIERAKRPAGAGNL